MVQDFHNSISQASHILQSGGLVAFPTDTLYGLGADVFNEKAIEKLYQLKGRSPYDGVPVLIATLTDLESLISEIPQILEAFVRDFWPGSLTLVLVKGPLVPDVVTGGLETIAIRMPDHPIPRAIIMDYGQPITGTSANRSGGSAPMIAQDVRDQLGQEVDLVIDGGRCRKGQASTILDLTGESPVVLRQGAVTLDELRSICHVDLVIEQ
jgi:L-threonylcarbamoyladenylate synthase